MAEPVQYSPVCPKCGRLTDRVVEPAPNQVFAGRLSPRAVPMGERVRCPRCSTWFPLSEGTRWDLRTKPVEKKRSEGTASVPEEHADDPGDD